MSTHKEQPYDYRGCRSSDGPMPASTCIVFKVAAPRTHVAVCPSELDAMMIVDALNEQFRKAARLKRDIAATARLVAPPIEEPR